MLSVVNNDEAGAEGRFGLDEICREGARTMLAAALEAEVDRISPSSQTSVTMTGTGS